MGFAHNEPRIYNLLGSTWRSCIFACSDYAQGMQTITFDTALPLAKTHFKDLEEFQIALSLMPQDDFELTEEQKEMLEKSAKEVEQPGFKGITRNELQANIKRNYA